MRSERFPSWSAFSSRSCVGQRGEGRRHHAARRAAHQRPHRPGTGLWPEGHRRRRRLQPRSSRWPDARQVLRSGDRPGAGQRTERRASSSITATLVPATACATATTRRLGHQHRRRDEPQRRTVVRLAAAGPDARQRHLRPGRRTVTLEDPSEPNVGVVKGGAVMEVDLPVKYIDNGRFTLILEDPSAIGRRQHDRQDHQRRRRPGRE